MAFPSPEMNGSYGGSSSSFRHSFGNMLVPHRGSLSRLDGEDQLLYMMEILLEDGSIHELQFQRNAFDFALRLFAIMDTESRGQVTKATVREFVTLRCPVFWRRDDDLRTSYKDKLVSPTFEEVWGAVAACSVNPSIDEEIEDLSTVELGLEGWMVFCRFIALAQYLEAKRRFSGRHLQQTMRHRNAPRGSEVVMVDVPPPVTPLKLSATQLATYERESHKCLPLPELDLDHSLLAAHDVLRRRKDVARCFGRVKIELFGASPSLLTSGSPSGGVDFCLTHARNLDSPDLVNTLSVRRSMKDMKWLNDTLVSHKTLGGTLCGRILPPFPGKIKSILIHKEDSSTNTSKAIAAATAGVGIIKEGIKSLWGSYLTPSPNSEPVKTISGATNVALPESYFNPNSPEGKARQLERYLNYLLEHPALSTSFPLNTILKASQSGLEAAKQSLEEHTRASKEIKEQTPTLDDGKLSTFWPLQGAGSNPPNLSWVRTAAQAAVALQLHGVLESTGMPSASARLQHASLPDFDNSRNSAWNNDDGDMRLRNDSDETTEASKEDSFEEGVTQVHDGLVSDDGPLDDSGGYDLLPLPVPAPERRILTDGNAKPSTKGGDEVLREARFRYGSPSLHEQIQMEDIEEGKPALLGDMAVDENIDKLREVIGSVDNTLSRCLASSGGIGRARRERLVLQLNVVRGLDSWEGLRGKFVAQRALLKGVSGIEQSREVFEESDLDLIEDVSWQTALANSAVSAAEDVRSTVRAARTAANAKSAASSAAVAAQKACAKGKFSNIDEARASQTRASIAQSHAIHAAVVEHEAKTVKRRATLALAHDVKCWNAHRKREILQTVLTYAKSQHEATRRAVDAWSCLRDGYVGSTIIPPTHARRIPPKPLSEAFIDDVEATIYGDSEQATIVPVEHELLKQSSDSSSSTTSEILSAPDGDTILPLVVASPIPEGDEDVASSRGLEDFGASSHSRSQVSGANSQAITTTSVHSQGTSSASLSLSPTTGSVVATSIHSQPYPGNMAQSKSQDPEENEVVEVLTSSMQSLVNGLMNWGGQYDDEEDFALPTGMAASIALEESCVLGTAKMD